MISRKNVPLTVVIRMPPVQTAKEIIGVLLLAFPSGVDSGTILAPSNGRLISHSLRNLYHLLKEL